jgi:shikimate dehydrogenase
VYDNFDLPDLSTLPDVLLAEPTLEGLNVTIPYKQAVMEYLDELEPRAAQIGAVNVIKIRHLNDIEKKHLATKVPGLYLTGYNSDIVGFMDSIRPLLMVSMDSVFDKGEGPVGCSSEQTFCPHTKALILGTGGASKAVYHGLKIMGIEPCYVSRRSAPGLLSYEQLTPQVMAEHTVIVNCSPVGMFPHVDECPAIPYDLLTSHHVCFDLIYNPAETLFMRRAAEQGATVQCGYDMLVGQALESYRIWTE